MKPFLKLKSVDEVLDIIKTFAPLPPETVALDEAHGYGIAEAFVAPADLPGFNRSTVDGYAARARDIFGAGESSPALLKCVGACPMGRPADIKIGPGEIASILTGGMLPDGADCAVMVEHTRPAEAGLVEIIRAQAPGDNVVWHDEDAKKGVEIFPRGKKLRPQEIGILAAFGQRNVSVYRKPRVAIISTGDEIAAIDGPLSFGQMYDVNSHSLAAICLENNALAKQAGIVGDDRGRLAAKIAEVLPEADIIAISGGSSAGMRDHTVEAFTRLPDSRLLAHGVAISPGKPFILAKAGEKILLGLPGHVSSALICARVFLRAILNRLQGGEMDGPQAYVPAILSRSLPSAQGRRDYIRCKLRKDAGRHVAIPLMAPSAVISGLVDADALIVCPENSEGLEEGQMVQAFLL